MNQPPTTRITGIHHLTAVSSDAQRTVDFYTRVLGLRLVKQTVNFDDPTSYHLSFADEEHGPGTLTFLEWKGAQRGQWGLGGTHHLAFETQDRDTLRQWKRWLADRGLPVTGPYNRVYFESIYFTDPDGLILEIATRGPGWTLDEAPDALGFELMEMYGDQAAFLSAGGYHHHLGLNTWESKGGSPPPFGSTGLYHVAILYPNRKELARALKRLVDHGVPIDGASDHGVSEAIYLRDPDGNGIEIYRDRPRAEWPLRDDGSLRMGTDRLDLRGLLSELDE